MPNEYMDELRQRAIAVGNGSVSPSGDDYMATLRKQITDANGVNRSTTLNQALSVNPDQYAEQKRVADRMGVAPAVVSALPDELSQRDKLRQIEHDAAPIPALQLRYSDKDFANLAHDDSGALSAIASAAKWLTSAPGVDRTLGNAVEYGAKSLFSGALSVNAAALRLANNVGGLDESDLARLYKNDPLKLQDTIDNNPGAFLLRAARNQQQGSEFVMNTLSPETKAQYGDLKYDTMEEGKSSWRSPLKIVGDALQSLPTMLAMAISAKMTGSAGAEAEANALAAGLTPAAAHAAKVLAAEQTMAHVGAFTEGAVGYAQQANQAREDADKVKDEDLAMSEPYKKLLADGYDPKVARIIVSADAAEQAGVIAGIVDAATNLVGGKFLGHLIGEGGKPLASTLKGFATEGATEFVQSAGEQAGQNLAFQKNLNPGQDLSEGVLESALQGLAVGGLTGGAFGRLSARTQKDEQAAKTAEQHAQVLTNLQQTMEASKLLERSPETLASYAQDLVNEGAPNVYVDAAALQASGVDLQALAQVMPSVATQLQQGQIGGDLVIPTSELLLNTIGQTFQQVLIDHARTDVNGMSRAEAKVYMQEKGDAVNAEIERVMGEQAGDATYRESKDKVQASMLANLNEMGRFNPKVNEHISSLFATHAAVMGARAGMTPETFAAKYPLRFANKEETGANVMDQAVAVSPNATGDYLTAESPAGKVGGVVRDGALRINFAEVAEDQRGKGEGKALYTRLIDDAHAKGLKVVSDYTVEAPAVRVYDALERMGYKVTRNIAGTLEDGSVYGAGANTPAFEVGAKADNALSQAQIEDPKVGVSNVLLTLGQNDDLYQYPRSDALDVRDISADKSWVNDKGEVATVQVNDVDKNTDDNKLWMISNTTPDDDVAAGTKSWILTLPTGKHATLTQKNGEVYINVSGVGEGNGGSAVYDLAANYALNNGLVFVGDPNGVSPAAMRRRLENMLSSAIKYGTTDHLKPHPDQYLGDESIGVPPLDWTNGDTLGNIRAMVDVSIASTEHLNPNATSAINFDLATQSFVDGEGNGYSYAELSKVLAGDGRERGAGQGGVRTLQRSALFKSLVQSEGARRAFLESVRGQQDSGSANPSGALSGTFYQGVNRSARGQISFANDITQQASVISMMKNADLSTFIHEGGHFFLEVQADLAQRINQRIAAGEEVSDGERSIAEDFGKVLDWMGVKATPEMSAMDHWAYLSLEEKRPHHESFARGFEAYAFEGKSPSLELTKLFQTFRAWLVNVYKSMLKSINAGKSDIAGALNVELSDEVRGVMDRMLATSEQIATAEAARNMGPLFKTAEEGGMDLEAYQAYHDMGVQASMDATDELQAKGLKDMQWLNNARSRMLKKLQKQHDALRIQIAAEVRAKVMAEPIYQAWAFLTAKGDKVVGDKPAGSTKGVNPEVDNLFTAIAKLGGLDRSEVKKLWGIDEKEKLESGVFGSPVVRKTGGASMDVMGQRLIEEGYLIPDEHGNYYPENLEQLFDDQRRGVDRFSIKRDMANAYGDAPIEVPDTHVFSSGKLRTEDLRYMYGTKDDAVWRKLSALHMTSDEVGLHPDVVAEKFGFQSGSQLVHDLAKATDPKQIVQEQTDQRMLEEHGDLSTPEGLERAADAAIHNDARARFVATELRALQHAVSVRQKQHGTKSTVDVLAMAAKEYAEKMINGLKVMEIRPTQYSVAAARSGRLAAKSMPNLEEAAMHKRNQLVNLAASKAATDAKAEVQRINDFFRKVVGGKDASIAKTRDMDMVMAARAVLANFGYGGKAKSAGEYLESVKSYNPDLYAILRQSTDAAEAVAKPFKELTFEELQGLHDEVAAMWHLSLRSRQMEVDGNKLDREDVAERLVARMEEIGIPDSMPGESSAVTETEQRAMNLSSVWATMQRVESWVDLKDGSNRMGAFRRNLWTPIKEAADKYRAAKLSYLRDFRAAFGEIAGTMKRGEIYSPELNYTFGKDSGGVAMNEILHAIIHTGNTSNMRKLLVGRGWATVSEDGAVDSRSWDTFINRLAKEGKLTKAHFDFAQKVWNLLETTKPAAQEAHRDAYGKYFEEITATPLQTPFGVYPGGYAPAMVDSRIVKDIELKKLIEEGKDGMAYAFPATSKGFTKGRVEYNQPLTLDLRTLPQHIDKVLLFSYMENPLRDAAKLMGMTEVSTPLNKQNPSFINGVLTPWLTRAARQQVTTPVVGAGYLMRSLNTLRNRSSMAAMFGNISNTAQQVTGFMMAGLKVKPSHLASATAQYLKSPKKMAENVAALSTYMDNRMSNEVEAMMGDIESILMDPNVYENAQAWTKRHTFFMQSAVDNIMGTIIWTGAFNQAQIEKYSHEDAVRIADAAVRQTQGSTLPEDVSRIETGPAYARILTQFYGYFNMQANLVGTELGKVSQEMGLRKGMGKGFYILLMGVYAPALVAEAIAQLFKGGPGDDDKDGAWIDDWLMALFVTGPMRNVTALVPFAGAAINSAVARFNSNPTDDKMGMSAAFGMIEASAGVPFDLYKAAVGEGNAQRTVRDVATLISLTTGLPASVAARSVGWLAGVAQGKTNPTSPVDAARGLVTGTASPDSKQR